MFAIKIARRIKIVSNFYIKKMNNGVSDEVNPLKRVSEQAIDAVETKKPNTQFQRVKKRKYAVLICYSGQGYLGLQRNPGRKTIEDDLLKAMLAANVINEEGYNQPKSSDFQRAARTDKGVSAVRQILSLKLPLEVDVTAVNSFLPDQIRLVGLKRTTKGFNCKSFCDARTYSYMMPSFALAPKDVPADPDYRITKDILERTKEVLTIFLGTHNYHNFTSRKKPLDPSAKRFIISFTSEEPVMCDGMEFVLLKVKGQSFMLHQIRKMVGLIIAVVKGLTTEETIRKAFEEERLDLPVAPGVGLVLEEVHYDRYNQRYGNDGIHDAIEWSAEKEQLEEFKEKFILSSIVKAEKDEKVVGTWLDTLPMHSYDVRNVNRNSEVKDEEEEEDDDEGSDDGSGDRKKSFKAKSNDNKINNSQENKNDDVKNVTNDKNVSTN